MIVRQIDMNPLSRRVWLFTFHLRTLFPLLFSTLLRWSVLYCIPLFISIARWIQPGSALCLEVRDSLHYLLIEWVTNYLTNWLAHGLTYLTLPYLTLLNLTLLSFCLDHSWPYFSSFYDSRLRSVWQVFICLTKS